VHPPSRGSKAKTASRVSPSDARFTGDARPPALRVSKVIALPNRRLRATRRANPRLRRWLVGRQHWTARAERPGAKDHPVCCLLPQNSPVRGAPPQSNLSSTPGLVVDSSFEGLDIPFVLMNRPRPLFPCHPAKGGTLRRTGVLSTAWNSAAWRLLPLLQNRHPHDATASLARGRYCNRGVTAPFYPCHRA